MRHNASTAIRLKHKHQLLGRVLDGLEKEQQELVRRSVRCWEKQGYTLNRRVTLRQVITIISTETEHGTRLDDTEGHAVLVEEFEAALSANHANDQSLKAQRLASWKAWKERTHPVKALSTCSQGDVAGRIAGFTIDGKAVVDPEHMM
eukprot:6472365-Amphidinium_carterae.1